VLVTSAAYGLRYDATAPAAHYVVRDLMADLVRNYHSHLVFIVGVLNDAAVDCNCAVWAGAGIQRTILESYKSK
jgi:hypothetical protein